MKNKKVCKNCGSTDLVEGRRVCKQCRRDYAKNHYQERGKELKRNKKKYCLACNELFTQWRKRQVICPRCRKTSLNTGYSNNQYIYTNEPGITVHRKIAENVLGRKLDYNEVVHHVDENTKNNEFENLWIMTRYHHGKLHGFLRQQRVIWEKSHNENDVNCWNSLRVLQTTAWLEMTGAKVIKLQELANQQPSILNKDEGSETRHVKSS